ncbi:MAG: hypothetical protein GSR86_01655 [Desulfurococcales archaeon]|nr:hypothetical protein [Desulfurococcales archaeon]
MTTKQDFNDNSLIIIYEDPDTSEGEKELNKTLKKLEKELNRIDLKFTAISEFIKSKERPTQNDMVYLLALFKTPYVTKTLDIIKETKALLLGKLPLEYVSYKISGIVSRNGCKEVILLYRKSSGTYREEQDDVWRLASLIENYSGIPVTPSESPELGGDCIVVATLSKSRLTSHAKDLAQIYGKRIVVESILSVVGDDVPDLITRALRAHRILF